MLWRNDPVLLVDPAGLRVSDNTDGVIGTGGILNILMARALPETTGGSITRRYFPGHSPGDSLIYGMSFDEVFPKYIGIVSGSVLIFTNVAPPAPSTDLVPGPLTVQGRTIYANISGGTSGQDYQVRWTITGSDNSAHTRTALLLCARTS